MSASNVINKFFAGLGDLIREDKGGKVSSKKIWGHVFMCLVGLTYVADGLHWYEMNLSAFNSMLIAACTLIGMKTLKEVFKKSTTLKDK